MKKCDKTVSGKHMFITKIDQFIGSTYPAIYISVACSACGLIDDLPKRKGKAV